MPSEKADDSNNNSSRISRFLFHPLPRMLAQIAILFGGLVILKFTLIKPGLGLLGLDEPVFRALQGIVTIICMYAGYVLLMRWYERRKATELALTHLVPDAIVGTLGAAGMISFVFGILWLAGAYQVLSAGSLGALLVPFIWVVVMASLEELLFRGIMYRIMENWLGTILALLISASIFGGMHITNDNADLVSVIAAGSGGLMMGAIYSMTRRLWIPIFFHIFWNFTQAMYGSVVSGAEIFGTYLQSVREGPVWLTGGPFGVENSLITIGLTFLVTALLLIRMKKQGLLLKRGQAAE